MNTSMNTSVDVADHPACILIVDDERHNRQLLEVMLAPDGFDLLTASSGEEALAMVARQPPDLILLDVMMPGMDGYQVASTIKGNPATKDIPVIMVTALDDHNARMLGLSAGAEEFLTKPVDRAELRVRVRNLARLKAYGDDKHSEMLESEVGLRTADLLTRTKTLEQQAAVLTEQAALLDLAQDAIVVRDMHHHIVFWSRGAEVMYGWRSREALGQDTYALLQAEFSQPIEEIEETLLGQGQWEGEAIHHKRDGTCVSVVSRWALQRDVAGVPARILTITMDITERKQAEQALHQSEAQLRQAQKMEAVGRLAGGIAHDFNNLLSVILGYSDMLIADLPPGNPMRADLEEIHIVGERAAELTRQLLAFSRQQVLQPRLVNLNDVMTQTEKMLRRLIGEDVNLTTFGAPDLATIKVDPSQIEQVVVNLAVNARDAMPQGGKLTIETANVYLDEAYANDHADVTPGPHVMLAVTDTGMGMDAMTQARMFEPFFTTKEAGKGTGLGLATIFGIVRQSGGTIWVYSEPGRGTAFKIYFPRADVGEEVPAEIPASGTLRGSETVLLVEDDERVRNVSRTILRRYGYHVLEAEGGDAALVICEQYPATIHLLLTDVVMSRMSGQQFAERLLATRPNVKVLYMSGYTDNAISHHGVLDPDLAFIQKPLTPEALAKKVRQVLNTPERALGSSKAG